MQKKAKELMTDTIIFAISSFGTKFLSFFLVPLYTNVLTTAEYGVADILTTTATLLIYILTVDIAEAVLRYAIERTERQSEILSFGLRVLVLSSLVLLLGLTIIWRTGLLDWEPGYYVFLFLYYFFTAAYQILSNYLRATNQITGVAVAGILSSLALILSNILFLLVIQIGMYGYLISLALGPAAGTLYCLIKIRLPLSAYYKNLCDAVTRREMLAYCFPLIFNSIALWINAFLDKYFITALCGVDQNGIYSVASKIPTILSTCYTVFSQAWNLSAIKEFDREDSDHFFANTYGVYNAAMTLACSALILMNIPLARILYAKDFFEAWNYSSVLLLSVMFNALTCFLGGIFTAVKDSRVIATTTLISAGTNIVLNALLIPLFQVQGAAIATCAAYAVMWVARLLMARKHIRLALHLRRDLVVYLLLILQVALEHTESHAYPAQVALFCLILILYRRYLKWMIAPFMQKLKQLGRHTP